MLRAAFSVTLSTGIVGSGILLPLLMYSPADFPTPRSGPYDLVNSCTWAKLHRFAMHQFQIEPDGEPPPRGIYATMHTPRGGFSIIAEGNVRLPFEWEKVFRANAAANTPATGPKVGWAQASVGAFFPVGYVGYPIDDARANTPILWQIVTVDVDARNVLLRLGVTCVVIHALSEFALCLHRRQQLSRDQLRSERTGGSRT